MFLKPEAWSLKPQMNEFDSTKVSVALMLTDRTPYDRATLGGCIAAAVEQDHPAVEVLVIDNRGAGAKLDVPRSEHSSDRLKHVVGTFANRAAMLNAAVAKASGNYLLVVDNIEKPVVLRRSAIRTMVMAATRHPVDDSHHTHQPWPGMVYADYELVAADGSRRDVHLLDWHEGRLRDNMDFGAAWLLDLHLVKKVGGFDEKYAAADLYDMRLRIGEHKPVAHIANRYAGSLYTVTAPAKTHDVFDYLVSGREVQIEMEKALTAHLKRIGANIDPPRVARKVEYTRDELARFRDCIATVVIPVNNRPQFIFRAIESVQAQTVREVEVIVVVNGGENDPTVPVVRRYLEGGDKYDAKAPPVRLIVIDVNNLGVCHNAAVAAARGKFYVQLDSDDRLKPDAVAKLLEVFDSDPTIGMVVGSYEVWNLNESTGQIERDTRVGVVKHEEWTADNGPNNLLRINGAGAPRVAHIKAIQEAGWFGVNDEPFCRNYGEDYDLVLRTCERHIIGRVWEPIYEVIRHSGGTDHSIDQNTVDRNDNAKDNMRLAAIRRRKQLNGR